MENHWWWRPGWKIGTRFYAWHITLDRQDDLHRLMDAYVESLRPFPTLDPVPARWRHITLQGLGHVEEVTDDRRDVAVEAVAARLARFELIESSFQRAVIFKEAVALPPSNPDAFTQLRNEIRAGIADAWGHTPEKVDGFRAHSSVAYSNTRADSALIRTALDEVNLPLVQTAFSCVELICMHRDQAMYEWESVSRVSVGNEFGVDGGQEPGQATMGPSV